MYRLTAIYNDYTNRDLKKYIFKRMILIKPS